MRVLTLALSAALLLGIAPGAAPSRAFLVHGPGVEPIRTNDNRAAAGVLLDGLLAVLRG